MAGSEGTAGSDAHGEPRQIVFASGPVAGATPQLGHIGVFVRTVPLEGDFVCQSQECYRVCAQTSLGTLNCVTMFVGVNGPAGSVPHEHT
jgi:hypothetical protein